VWRELCNYIQRQDVVVAEVKVVAVVAIVGVVTVVAKICEKYMQK
jgi:hypothetical protein